MAVSGSMQKTISLPSLNGGLNTADPQNLIANNQSPDMLNVWYKNNTLQKRYGQEVTTDFGAAVYRTSGIFGGFRVVHAGSKLYKWDGAAKTEIKTGVQAHRGVFIEFGDDLYYLDGARIWDITPNFSVTEVSPYKPVVQINCKPDLSSSLSDESFNLIGAGFTVKYNGDGVTTVYKLPLTDLDATAVSIYINNVPKTEGVNFRVNRTAADYATVDFNPQAPNQVSDPVGAPGTGTNNVWITAYKTIKEADGVTPKKNRILKCTLGTAFGGESSGIYGGTRVFVSGSAGFPLHYWHSDLGRQGYGIAYFPDTGEEILDQNSERITAMAKMANQLVIFKTASIFAVGYQFDGENVYYPVAECQSTIGCDMPESIQLVDNRLVFGNTKHGIMMLASTSSSLENNVKPLSANINNLVLKESNLESACSVDFERYYWLCVGGRVYLWDYDSTPYYNLSDYDAAQRRLAWYRFSNINASEFAGDTVLYYAKGTKMVKFTNRRSDFGDAYECYVKTKAFDLGEPQMLKNFETVYPSFRSDGNIRATVIIGSEKSDNLKQETFERTSFAWNDWNWGTFQWGVIKFSKTFPIKARIKGVVYIQIKVESGEKYFGFGLTGLTFDYRETKPIRRL